jgi:pimeloyl-ACP methyl ester carboxylesterase
LKLRLYHHPDGARVAYRETGTGPGLVLLHSALLSHREFEPIVEPLADRYRVILPDLPLHGDSEDRPRHPYTLDWLAEVIAAFCTETAGPRPLVGGHDLGAQILLRALELRPCSRADGAHAQPAAPPAPRRSGAQRRAWGPCRASAAR